MKGYRFFVSDLKAAMQKQRFFFVSVIIFTLLWIQGYIENAWGASDTKFCMENVMVHCFRGAQWVAECDRNNSVKLPIGWLMLFLGAHLSAVGYAEELTAYGQQLFIRSGGRVRWLLSKCGWNTAVTGMYFGLGIATCMILTAAAGGSMDFGQTRGFLCLAVLLCMSWNLFQMCIAMYAGSFISIFVSTGMLITSVYIGSPFLPGNYMMFLRIGQAAESGLKIGQGYGMALVLCMSAMAGSIIKVKRFDYLIKD